MSKIDATNIAYVVTERECYVLCETGRFLDALTVFNEAKDYLKTEEIKKLRESLIEDYQEIRENIGDYDD